MYDFIIVGAGTAGSVLAERLTASGSLRVLLVEAGGRPWNPFVKIPAGFAKLFKTSLDWNFQSEPGAAVGGRRVFIPRGKMLGGSANMNAQVHQWCHPADFDGWAAGGATGWSFEDVAPTFREQERWSGERSARRGGDGAMVISSPRHFHPLSQAFVDAVRAICPHSGPDYNGGPYEGAWAAQVAHRDGRRFSAYDAFLLPAMQRPNLEVRGGARVARVLVEKGRAVGVVLRRGSTEETHRAGKGVVLAAGAYGSPHVLLLSGIGPAAALQAQGIGVVHDAPEVGRNLQEHPLVPLVFRTSRTDTLKNAEGPGSLLRYLFRQQGMLASNAAEAIAFTRSGVNPEAAPDLELIAAPFGWRNEGLDPPNMHGFTIAPAAVAPRSRGSVTLTSADPSAAPRIDLGLLSDPEGIDARVLLAGIRLARRVAATAPLVADCAGAFDPAGSVESDADLRAWMNTRIQTVYHPTSTCRMGSDPGAVVDPELRVRGVDGLWVADASVMPTVPRGHPNAVVAMIASRAAAFIA